MTVHEINHGKSFISLKRFFFLFFLLTKMEGQFISKISSNKDFSGSSATSSVNGGSLLYIQGTNFDEVGYNNQVFIGFYICLIDNYYTSSSLLVCRISENYYGEQSIDVVVRVKGIILPCPSGCLLNFLFDSTPNFHTIYPQNTYAGNTINIYGIHRANSYSELEFLKIDGRNCILTDDQLEHQSISYSWYQYISCKLPEDLKVGNHTLQMVAKVGTGLATSTRGALGYKVGSETQKYNIRIHPKITAVSVNEGYLDGQIISISGVGFGDQMENLIVLGV